MRNVTILIVFLFMTIPARAEIIWSVENNFRLLKPVKENAGVREWLDKVVPYDLEPRKSTLTIGQLRKDGFNSVPVTYYNTKNRMYEKEYVHSRRRKVRLTFVGSKEKDICLWKANNLEYSGRCNDFLFPSPLKLGHTSLSVIRNDGVKEVIDLQIEDKLIFVLGDSFVSGEGVPDVPCKGLGLEPCSDNIIFRPIEQELSKFARLLSGKSTKLTQWLEPDCNRSIYAWPFLAAFHYARKHPTQSVTILSRACSGAETPNLIYETFPGKEKDGSSEKPQLMQMMADLCPSQITENSNCSNPRKPDLVILSVGGNDVGFADRIVNVAIAPLYDIDHSKRENNIINLNRELERRVIEQLKVITNQSNGLLYKIAGKIFNQEKHGKTNVIHALYPDPLHADRKHFCGIDRIGKKRLLNVFGNRKWRFFKPKVQQKRIVALYEGFVSRLVGVETPPYESYRGLLHAGRMIASKYEQRWHVVETRKHDDIGPYGYHQSIGYQPNGYCVQGDDINGRWFLTVKDSIRETGKIDGTMHPNIFGQLFLVQKVYPKIEDILNQN